MMKVQRNILMLSLVIGLLMSGISCGGGSQSEAHKTPPADTTPPVISVVSASSITQTSAVITWTTDEPATSQIEYGVTTSYGSSSASDSNLVTSHSVKVSGFTANTAYHCRVKSKDASQNLAVSGDYNFSTTAPQYETVDKRLVLYDFSGSMLAVAPLSHTVFSSYIDITNKHNNVISGSFSGWKGGGSSSHYAVGFWVIDDRYYDSAWSHDYLQYPPAHAWVAIGPGKNGTFSFVPDYTGTYYFVINADGRTWGYLNYSAEWTWQEQVLVTK